MRQAWSGARAPSDEPWRIGAELSAAMDACLRSIANSDDLTVVAVGGYGRQELGLHSDIDLLLLHDNADPAAVRAILYPLWDAGLKVGHALRTVKETVAKARDDLTVLCAQLSARLVAGPSARLDEMEAGLTRLLKTDRLRVSTLLAAEEASVWQAEPYLLQDADIKEGRGGLRSLHRLEWDRRRAELAGEKSVESAAERTARRSLLSVRAALHAVQGRAYDRYAMELRSPVGQWLGRDALEVATEVCQATRTIDSLAGLRWGRTRGFDQDPVAVAGRQVSRFVRNRWQRASSRGSTAPPLRLAYDAATSGHGRLSPWEFELSVSSDPPAWTSGDRTTLVSLLASGRTGWDALMALWEAGWLPRSLPELRHLRGLAQAAPFHAHPVDAHLGRTVAEVLALADGAEPWCADLAEDVGGLDEVLLSAFLHDAGKGLGGDHSASGARLATALLARVGFSPATVDLVADTVRNHLLLSDAAFRKDIEDPDTVRSLATEVGDLHRLNVLTLLSVADARATGPDSWSPWRGTLLRSLHRQVARQLTGETSDFQSDELERLEALVSEEFTPTQVESHLSRMPAAYLLRFGAEAVADHLRLVTPPPRIQEVRASIAHGSPVSTVTIATRDRPGLLAKVAGVFALHNLGVLEARVATRADGLALDTFRVVDTGGSEAIGLTRWPAVREHLEQVAAGSLDIEARVVAKRAAYQRTETKQPPVASVLRQVDRLTIEVRASDRVGLLFDLATAIHSLGLDVQLAKIDTRGSSVVDVIEAIDRVDPSVARDEEIRNRIERALA
ncbi:MAG TPA: HD domain-containing protein [Acidimicrobiia bacterium]|nr:HD domain-containing protein [Acidimicrobiia bacterium]